MHYDNIVTLHNEFHGTTARVKAQPWDCLSRDQMFRLSKRLCPNRLKRIKCECGGLIRAKDIKGKLKLVPHVTALEHLKTFIIVPINRAAEIEKELIKNLPLKKEAEHHYRTRQ